MKLFLASLLVGLGFAGFMALGFWQVHRLAWKEGLIADIARYQSKSVALAPYVRDPSAEFRRGTLKGHWDATGTFKTRNVLMNDNFGYWVATPLTLADGSKILVNRGWVQDGQQDRVLAFKLPAGQVTLNGTLRRPGLLDKEPQTKNYPGPWVLFTADTTPADHPELVPAPVVVELWNQHKQYAIFWFIMAGLLLVMAGFSLLKRR